MKEALDAQRWKALDRHSFGRRRMTELQTSLDELAVTDPLCFRFNDFVQFYRTGSRVEFEVQYFDHRRRLEVFALAVLAEIEASRDAKAASQAEHAHSHTGGAASTLRTSLQNLEDMIWTVCDEYSWCLPAHMPLAPAADQRDHRHAVDLFAAETAFTLAEIVDLLGDRLAPGVVERARREVEERVLDSYLNFPRAFSWEGVTHNWAAVCGGSIGAAALYLVKDKVKLKAIIDRLAPSLDSYLSGFADDGACTEGMGYWTYGFGHFLSFADLVRRYDPNLDLLALPAIASKIEAISLFPQRARLVGPSVIGFSDAFSPFRFPPAFVCHVHKRFPAAELQDWAFAEDFDTTVHRRWSQHLRDFIWFDPAFPEEPTTATPPGATRESPADETAARGEAFSHFFSQSEWLVMRRQAGAAANDGAPVKKGKAILNTARAFAAKGGNNGEPHNHNDVGSFMIVAGDENPLDDFGAGLYEKGYFNQDRYRYFISNSHSHSVPLIGGRGQRPGQEFKAAALRYVPADRATAFGGNDLFSLDLAPAYGIEGLSSLVRTIEIDPELTRLTIADRFVFSSPNGLAAIPPAVFDERGRMVASVAGAKPPLATEIRERFVTLLDVGTSPVASGSVSAADAEIPADTVVVSGKTTRSVIAASAHPLRIELSEQPFMAFGNILKIARIIDFIYPVPETGILETKFTIKIGVLE